MLTRLTVRNYALIQELDISFGSGLTIITGETGAGKSILLGALGLVLGQRADVNALAVPDDKCVVEAFFDLTDMDFSAFFNENDLDDEKITCIRREINPQGKSRAFINDTPVNLQLLKDFASRLIDIHSQHENLLLNDASFRMNVLDQFSGSLPLAAAFHSKLKERNALLEKLRMLQAKESEGISQYDFANFQLNELEAAQLGNEKIEQLEAELELLENSETVQENLFQAKTGIAGEHRNLLLQLQEVAQLLQQAAKFSPGAVDLEERVKSIRIELQDIADEIEKLEGAIQNDPQKQALLNERIDLLNRLLSKHRVKTVEELVQIKDELAAGITAYESLEDEIKLLTAAFEKSNETLRDAAIKLTKNRKKGIEPAETQLAVMLKGVGMPHAVVKLELTPLPDDTFRSDGADQLAILFRANKGSEFRELSKVASGGELSRLMLCIKSLMARTRGLPTLIFDEIDTGISGEIAGRVGGIVKQLSKERQVIAITHLPQMAGKGNTHLHVVKTVVKNKTQTAIRLLTEEERIIEIARMLSGDQPSAAAVANAKELLEV